MTKEQRIIEKQIAKIVHKYVYEDCDLYIFNSIRDLNKMVKEIAALEQEPDQDLPSDEDIEEWADNLATDVTNGVTPSKDKHGHLIKATLFTGAKAMRDGWIKSNRK